MVVSKCDAIKLTGQATQDGLSLCLVNLLNWRAFENSLCHFLSQVMQRIQQIWNAKLKVTEEVKGEGNLPRIIRLSRRLKLSEKETIIMIYTLTCQVGEARTSALRFGRFAGRQPHPLPLGASPV